MMNPAEFANIAAAERDFWWYRGMRDILARMLDPYLDGRKVRRALEGGCGTGYYSWLLQHDRGLPVVPLDLGWEGLEYARAMGVRDGIQGDLVALPFADAAFDLVLSLDVLVHLERGREYDAMRELARVLEPGGLMVLRVSALDILHSRHSDFAFEKQRFTRRRLMGLAAACGIRPLRCSYANSLLMPVALAKFRLWEPLTRQEPSSGVQPVSPWLDRLLSLPLAAEARWLGAGHDLPLGQSLVLIGEKIQ